MVEPKPEQILARAAAVLASGSRAVLCHIVRSRGSTPGKPGWRLLVTGDETVGNLGGGAFEAVVSRDARSKLHDLAADSEIKRYYLTEEAAQGEATGMVCGGFSEVFLEVMTAAPAIVICGGGPVGQAVAQAGVLAGFEALVVDDREEFLRPELFPAGTRRAAVDRGFESDFLASCGDRELFVAIVTRCWETDLAALTAVLRQAPRQLAYLGLLGSRRKVERIESELHQRGLSLAGLPYHAPIGLPLGGDSPGEIAIAILAQMLETRYGRGAERLEAVVATAAGSDD